jgi:hypothetical protein
MRDKELFHHGINVLPNHRIPLTALNLDHPQQFNQPEETTMAKMKAALAAVLVMEKEGVSQAFGVPGAAINPLYAALRERQSIAHVLARHVEGASHMAEGYTLSLIHI